MSDDFQKIFDHETVRSIMLEEIEKGFVHFKYHPALKEQKVNEITSRIINRLSSLQDQNFKYVSHSILFKNGDQDFQTFSVNMWDDETDGSETVDYSTDEFRFVMTVWGLLAD